MTLRSCPVCNHNNTHTYEEGFARRYENNFWFIDDVETFIECDICGHTASGWSEDEAAEEWNTKEPDEWELRWWKKNCDI